MELTRANIEKAKKEKTDKQAAGDGELWTEVKRKSV